ncbi:hypothetical protein P9273_23570 [Mesorhizobium sp. WSM4935]|uniref:hypothetical protein n=1 Tax=Mesorhizobium sp. WSM4935 TaxID=3038547 RepID=UPI0024152234|nr:hypothetical protein [Mesorhizobium sp. WSM4935]MDG4878058.1 hypothetical protein [Mesorhizobium sp. WSM4935]
MAIVWKTDEPATSYGSVTGLTPLRALTIRLTIHASEINRSRSIDRPTPQNEHRMFNRTRLGTNYARLRCGRWSAEREG